MTNKSLVALIILLGSVPVLLAIVIAIFLFQKTNSNEVFDVGGVLNFEECREAGGPVSEGYPRTCTFNIQTFTEDIGNVLEKQDVIRVSNIEPNDVISSPVTIKGQARGTWFFEASFPITIEDIDGNEIGSGIATAQDDWMTENFVPFTAEIEFTSPETSRGNILLHKDNPSGLFENDDLLEIPIIFQ